MTFTIRKPELKDFPDIRNIFSDWYRDISGDIEEENVDYWTSKVSKAMTGEIKMEYLVAVDENDFVRGIIGSRENIHKFLVPFANKKAVEVCDLFISKKYQRLGIGKKLIENFTEQAKRNYKEVILASAERFKESWKFYDKLGFIRAGTVRSEITGELYLIFHNDLW